MGTSQQANPPKASYTQYHTIRTLLALALIISALWIPEQPAQAARAVNLEVECNVDDLIAGINEAQASTNKTLTLAPNCLYLLGNIVEGETGLPRIETSLTINGNGATIRRHFDADAPFRLLDIGPSVNVTIRDLTLQGGTTGTNGGNGGALKIGDSSLPFQGIITLENVTLHQNSSPQGGAIHVENSILLIRNSTFSENHAFENGGAIHSGTDTIVTLQDSQLNDNTASIGGGAVMAQERLNLVGATFERNQAESRGGAIHAQGPLNSNRATFLDNSQNGFSGVINGGGAIYSEDELTLSNTTFQNNTSGSGGALFFRAPTVATIQSSTFTNNRSGEGGAAYFTGTENTSIQISQSDFVSNIASIEGGAIFAIGNAGLNKLAITQESTFIDNSAAFDGGAISTTARNVQIEQSTFDSNTANDDGGAIFMGDAGIPNQLTIQGSDFKHNVAQDNGGALFLWAVARIQESLFSSNQALDRGGAIFTRNDFEIARSKFDTNIAEAGGGALYRNYPDDSDPESASFAYNNLWINNESSTLGTTMAFISTNGIGKVVLRHETIVGPDDPQNVDEGSNPAAIAVKNIHLDLVNSIIAGQPFEGVRVSDNGTLRSSHNLYFDNNIDIDNSTANVVEQVNDLNADPRFVDAANHDYHLQPESPAINSATDEGITEDYDGNARPHGAGVDRGAFEYQGDDPVATPTSTPTPDITATPGTPSTPLPPTSTAESTSTQVPTRTPVSPTTTPATTPIATDLPPTATPIATTTQSAPTAEPTTEPTSQPDPSTATPEPTGTAQPDETATANPTPVMEQPTATLEPGQTPTPIATGIPSVSPTASPTASPTGEVAITGLTVNSSTPIIDGNTADFSAAVAAGSNVVYTWDFGDGNSGRGKTATHVYAAPGTYSVRVTASNRINSLQAALTVNVEPRSDTPSGSNGETQNLFLPLILR